MWKKYPDSDFEKAGRKWKGKGGDKKEIIWKDEKEGTSNSFLECYNNVIKKAPESESKWNDVKKYMGGAAFKFMNETEVSLKCASICEPGLFYLAHDVSNGKPETDCFNALVDHLQSTSKNVGYMGVVAALILICAGFCAFPFCCYKKEEGEDMMNKAEA